MLLPAPALMTQWVPLILKIVGNSKSALQETQLNFAEFLSRNKGI